MKRVKCNGRSLTMALWWCIFLFFMVDTTTAKSFTIHNVVLSSDYSITVEDLLKNVTKSLVEYDRNLDDYINWVDFDNMFKEMLDHSGAYNLWSIGDVRRYFLQSRDYYFDAVTAVYGWCGQIDILMTAYVELFTEYAPEAREAQKNIIVHVLDEGIEKMSEALEKLDMSRENLNTGVVGLTNAMMNVSQAFKQDQSAHETRIHELNNNAMKGFSGGVLAGVINLIVVETKYKPDAKAMFERIKSSFDFMKTKLTKSIDKAAEIKEKLLAEIQSVASLQAAAKSNKVLLKMNFYSVIKNAANKLIAKCTAYQTKHGLKV